jgi:hypothetical protein
VFGDDVLGVADEQGLVAHVWVLGDVVVMSAL